MNQEGVVLLHGIIRSRYSMWRLERYLQKHGFKTLNLGYPSRQHPLSSFAALLNPSIDTFAKQCSTVHFVGHSMGGLIIHDYIDRFAPENVGRVVMLGTPHGGSEWADWLKNFAPYRWLYGLAGQDLGTDRQRSAWKHGDLGILAGVSHLPLTRWFLKKPSDGTVTVDSTKIDGMKDHVTLSVGHTFFPEYRCVHEQVLHFLQQGYFRKD